MKATTASTGAPTALYQEVAERLRQRIFAHELTPGDWIGDSARVITKQQFIYYTKTKKGKIYGETTVLFNGYELRKNFKKGHFGLEISSTAQEAYEKDSAFWTSVRLEPLSRQQDLYARYQDSIALYMKSESYLDSMDRVLNKITWKKMLIFGQIFNDHKKERMWILPPITSMLQPVAFGGARLKLAAATVASGKS